MQDQLRSVPAIARLAEFGIRNCVIIPESWRGDAAEIFQFARTNEVFVYGESGDEAGDDQCVVQSGNRPQQCLNRDLITALLRANANPGSGE